MYLYRSISDINSVFLLPRQKSDEPVVCKGCVHCAWARDKVFDVEVVTSTTLLSRRRECDVTAGWDKLQIDAANGRVSYPSPASSVLA